MVSAVHRSSPSQAKGKAEIEVDVTDDEDVQRLVGEVIQKEGSPAIARRGEERRVESLPAIALAHRRGTGGHGRVDGREH